jgi:hypothetical protein
MLIKLNRFLGDKKKGNFEGYGSTPNYSFLHRIAKFEDPEDSSLKLFGEKLDDIIMMTGKLSVR